MPTLTESRLRISGTPVSSAGAHGVRVLVLHNRYQIAGGEESAVRQEVSMLRHAGAEVDLLEVTNDQIESPFERAAAALDVIYSLRSRRLVASRIAAFQPDVVHVHNFFPVLTPAIFDSAPGVPFVQTLHNYRLICANAELFREGRPCEQCLGKRIAWPAVQHGCYRDSRAGSAAVALMLGAHKLRNTWNTRVARFIALTEFARRMFVRDLGVDADKIVVKPNAAADAGLGDGAGGYALFVGRLSPEKGVATLLKAARLGLGMPLKVAGTGPLAELVVEAAAEGVLDYVGARSQPDIVALMKGARVLLLPSLWYEGLPMVVPEAYSTGLPIIASDIGALASLVSPGRTGMLVLPNDAEALALAARTFAASPRLEAWMRTQARLTYDRQYRPEQNVNALLDIYRAAMSAVPR